MPRQRKTPNRPGGKLDPRQFFIIACEGRHTEKDYFEALATNSKNTKVFVEVLEREDVEKNNSSPAHVYNS